ncbi:MAG: nuclear transport factor 2 family protein [Steroidobacteraceae bacterium]
MSEASLESRIRQLEDREAIRELVARYTMVVDDRDIDAIGELFTPDGSFRSKDGVIVSRGRAEVIEAYHKRFAALTLTLHVGHDHLIKFDDADPDLARGWLTSHAEVHRNGRTMVAAMRYEDTYRRHDGCWRFQDRLIHFLYYLPVEEYAEGFGVRDRMRAYESPREADIPESLAAWQDYARRFLA